RLPVPAVNFITDFGVHPLWVHKGIDLNLTVHPGPAAVAARRSGQPTIACGPLVSEAYGPIVSGAPGVRRIARQELGLAPEDHAVLVVAGSWGIGGIGDTFEAVSASGRFVPVVVCGHDEALRRRVTAMAGAHPGPSVVLGWTDQMPRLMAACDALVENAGGLTSLEAMRARLPVVSYQPIAGHGKDNTRAMDAAGVSRLAADRTELLAALDELTSAGPARQEQVDRGRAMFVSDGATAVLAANASPPRRALGAATRPTRIAVRATAALAGVTALAWGGMTTGVGVAAAAGAGVAHGNARAGAVAYFGVRLNSAEASDPRVIAELQALDISAVVDQTTALDVPTAVRQLAAQGVDVENGGQGGWRDRHGEPERPTLWSRARGDVRAAQELRTLTGQAVTVFMPGRRVNAFDLVDCKDAHSAMVVPNVTLSAADIDDPSKPVHLTARHVYLVNGLQATPAELTTLLHRLHAGLSAEQLSASPLAALR
nr:hypothetical protein [Actinomycetota bacterium]